MPLVLFDDTHKEDVALASEGEDGLSKLANDLRSAGFEVRVAGPAQDLLEEDLAKVDVIVIAFPKVPFSADIKERLTEFVHGGGGLLLTAEWGNIFENAAILNQLSEPWGLTFNSDRVADTSDTYERDVTFQGEVVGKEHVPQFPKIKIFAPHPITKDVNEVGHFSGCSMEAPEGSSLAWSSNTSFGDLDGDAVQQADERSGPLMTAAFLPEKGGRVVGIGDTSMLTNKHYDQSDNAAYLRNIFGWLVGRL